MGPDALLSLVTVNRPSPKCPPLCDTRLLLKQRAGARDGGWSNSVSTASVYFGCVYLWVYEVYGSLLVVFFMFACLMTRLT